MEPTASTSELFPTDPEKPEKKARGRTDAAHTPLHLRTHGVTVDEATRHWVHERLGRQLGKFALHIEEVEVRFRDLNGPKGGVDCACLIMVRLSGLEPVVVEEKAKAPREAFDIAAGVVKRAVRRHLERADVRTPRNLLHRDDPASANAEPAHEGAHATDHTSMAREGDFDEVSADDSHTMNRNLKENEAGLVAALEDSEQERPSRKSTRGSANRARRDVGLHQREVHHVASPAARAERNQNRKDRP